MYFVIAAPIAASSGKLGYVNEIGLYPAPTPVKASVLVAFFSPSAIVLAYVEFPATVGCVPSLPSSILAVVVSIIVYGYLPVEFALMISFLAIGPPLAV